MTEIYYPNEESILCDWLCLPRPKELKAIDLFDPSEDAPGIWPEVAKYADEERALANAVARIVLGAIQQRLPQVGFFSGDEIQFGRHYFKKPNRPVEVLPQFLFTINWADSGPGISWPETYHAAYLPGFDRYVVTASQDSIDVWGYTEIAIGWFGGDVDVLIGVADVIIEWWRNQAICDQERWEYVWAEGTVSTSQAETWAEEVWGNGYEVDYASLQTEGVDEDEYSDLVNAILESDQGSDARKELETALARCLDPYYQPSVEYLPEIISYAATLGRDGRYLLPQLMRLIDELKLDEKDLVHAPEIRAAAVFALEDIKPADEALQYRLVAILSDPTEPVELRSACACALRTVTGLEEYDSIRKVFPRVIRGSVAPHDSPIFSGGYDWYSPEPSAAMRKTAKRLLQELMAASAL